LTLPEILLQRDIQRIIKQDMLPRIFLFIIVGTACKTAISFAVDDMMRHKESHANMNPELAHVSTGIVVGNGKVVMVFDFEV
jgi:hypothetical protein